jgi:hypothetical protein
VETHRVPVAGGGRVTVPAYGLADAEHRVEKEIARRLAGATVSIVAVERPGGEPRIVEEFSVEYRVTVTLEVEAAHPREARIAAFRAARSALEDSRYVRTVWEAPPPGSPTAAEAG